MLLTTYVPAQDSVASAQDKLRGGGPATKRAGGVPCLAGKGAHVYLQKRREVGCALVGKGAFFSLLLYRVVRSLAATLPVGSSRTEIRWRGDGSIPCCLPARVLPCTSPQSSSHQTIKSSDNQVIRASSHQTIKSSDHQVIRSCNHPAIGASGHQVTPSCTNHSVTNQPTAPVPSCERRHKLID